jgi:hypothetical protein
MILYKLKKKQGVGMSVVFNCYYNSAPSKPANFRCGSYQYSPSADKLKTADTQNPKPRLEKLDTNGALQILQPTACGILLYNAKNVGNYTVIPS